MNTPTGAHALLFQLRFTTAVHFGAPDSALSLYSSEDHFRADTLFSALCHTANALYGPDGAAELCADAKAERVRLSDSMLWMRQKTGEDAFFLPLPMMLPDRDAFPSDPSKGKAMKKLRWLPVDALDAFAASLRGQDALDPRALSHTYGKTVVVEQAAISRTQEDSAASGMKEDTTASGTEEERTDAVPYPVGTFRFSPDSGLYFLALCADAQSASRLTTLVQGLGYSGIGGKVSSGCGKFTVERVLDLDTASDRQAAFLREALRQEDAEQQILLTTSLPGADEMNAALDGAYFQITRRGGFVQPSAPEEHARKKRVQYFLTAGSVLRRRFRGDVYPVSGGEQPAYRYARPLFLGVSWKA